ncbi:Zinc finger protein [Plecturocebus cupreus]
MEWEKLFANHSSDKSLAARNFDVIHTQARGSFGETPLVILHDIVHSLPLVACFFFVCLLVFGFVLFWRRSFVLLLSLECSGMISAHCNLCLRGSSDSCALVSPVAGVTGTHHHAWLIFVFLVEMGFHHVGQAGLEFLALGDLPSLASRSAGIIGVSYQAGGSLFQLITCKGTASHKLSAAPLKSLFWVGAVANTYNPSTSGGEGRWIMRSGVQDQPGQYGETPSLLKIQKLAGCSGSLIAIAGILTESTQQSYYKNSSSSGQMPRLMPIIPAL